MPSNIKIKSLARSAGKTVDGSGNPTTAVSGSDMAYAFLKGDINQTVYRHVPDTVGSISGTSPRPVGDQYQFYEFDGVVPSIAFTSISTISDNTNSNIGKQISFTFTTTGVTSTNYNVKLYGYDANQQNESLLATYSGYTTNVTNESKTFTGTLFPNQINFFRLLLTTEGSPTLYGEDTTSIYIYPTDLTITSVVLSPTFTGAGTYNYTTGSVGFTVNVNGGVTPYYYNFNEAGYGSADANTSTFNNSATTVQDAYTITVKDSNTPTFDTATNTPTTFRPPIRVAISSLNSVVEPYVNYSLGSTITNNTDGLTLTYAWAFDGAQPGTSTSASPTIYHTSLGPKTHRVDITQASNSSIRHYNTASTTVQVSPTSNVVVTYTPGTETWAATFDSVINASYGTRTYEYQGRSKDANGSYTDWGNSVSVSSNSISAQSFAGKTTTAQYVQIRVRVRRTYSTFDEVSAWAESNEALVPIKGVVSISNQTNLLTGGDRTFTGTVTLGGTNDNGFSVQSVSSTTTDSSVTASGTKTSSGVITITVNNPCTSVNDGTASHTANVTDGNGYHITGSFTTQYKINSTNIGLSAPWISGLEYSNAYINFFHTIPYTFTTNNFQYKTSSGGTYANVTTGGAWISYQYYSAPTSDQTWYYRAKSSGGTYTESDYQEITTTIYGYPNQSYGYSLATVLSTNVEATSGTLSQVSNMFLRVKRTSNSFAGISAEFDYTTPGGSSFLYINSLSDASINDSASSFISDLYTLYNSSTFVTGVSTGKAILTYTFLTNKTYLHTLTNDFTVLREPGSLTVSTSGLVNGYAIRGNSLALTGVYTTPGPPTAALYLGYSLVYVNIDSSMSSTVTGQSEYYTTSGNGPYYRTNTGGGYGRYTQTSAQASKTPGSAHTDVTYTFYANTYTAAKPSSTWTYYNQGDSFNTSVTYTVKGKRVNSIGGTKVPFGYPGSTLIEGITSGTWYNNITGPDGTADVAYDYLTYNAQYSSDNSTWTDLGAGISYYDPGTFGTTYFRIKVVDDWGTTTYSTSYSYTTRDWDYGLTLTNTGTRQDVWYQGFTDTKYVDLSYYTNGFTLSETDPGAGSGTLVNTNAGYSSYFLYVGDLTDSDDSSFPGAYLSATTTLGSVSISRIFQDSNSPYYWKGNGSTTSYSDIKNSTSYSPTTLARGLIVVFFTTAGTYGQDVLITITGQKSSSSTSQQKKYYFRYRTPAETNEITLTQISTSCSIIGVRARTGTLTTADKIVIQTSTDNSTWTDAHTITSIAANTNYDRSITGIGSLVYVRALLYQSTTLKTTSSTITYNKYTPVAGSTYSVISLNTACTSFSYRVDRGGSADSNTNATYDISWYTYDEYGQTTLITTAYGKSYNTTYSGQSLNGFPCNTYIQAQITPYSSTGCTGTSFIGSTLIYVSDSINTNCSCASGGTGGCLVYGTLVEMGDGTFKKVEDLELGEVVKSISINGLDVNIDDNWKDFYTNEFQYEEGLSIITNIVDDGFTQYYIINENLKLTYEHPIFIKRAEVFMFTQTEGLVLGDYIFKENGEFELVSSIDIIDDYVQTININIEENDVYFANGILVHNVLNK